MSTQAGWALSHDTTTHNSRLPTICQLAASLPAQSTRHSGISPVARRRTAVAHTIRAARKSNLLDRGQLQIGPSDFALSPWGFARRIPAFSRSRDVGRGLRSACHDQSKCSTNAMHRDPLEIYLGSPWWSGCRDLNPGPLDPQSSALTKLRHSPHY
jgi:hypothetical protein